MTKAFEMLLNPGDSLLVENPTYSGALAYLKPMNVNLVGVDVESDGINYHQLEDILTNWDEKKQGKRYV